jgi:CheY-like chemotaxis protein
MGGDVKASSALGTGSTFIFEIAVERGAVQDFQSRQARSRRVRGIQNLKAPPRILIADDVQDNREWLTKLLMSLGFAVRTAENGEVAVRAWEEWSPQLILMDMHMPVLDGLKASRSIKSCPAGKETVIIALTADALEDHHQIVLEHDVDDFIAKPCQENELLEKIRSHLGLVYAYDEEVSAGATEPVAMTSIETNLEPLIQLPADLIPRLRRAILSGDKSLLDDLIVTIEEFGNPKAARAIQELADSYQYDRLIQLLECA